MHHAPALDRVNSLLNNASSSDEGDIGVYGKCYLLSVQPGQGLQWNELPKNLAKPNLLKISEGKLEMDFVRKV